MYQILINNKNWRINGFTLIEILVVMAILAVLTTIAISSTFGFQSRMTVKNYRQQLEYVFVESINKSILTNQTLILRPLFQEFDIYNPDNIQGTGDWRKGLSVLWDVDGGFGNDTDYSQEDILQSITNDNYSDKLEITLKASFNKQYVRFQPDGSLWPSGRFIICHKNIDYREELIFSQAGTTRVEVFLQKCNL